MNALLAKIAGSKIIQFIGKVIKPLPLSGIIKEIKQVNEAKWEYKKVINLAIYVLSGLVIWGVITGKITVETAIALLKLIGI